MNGDCEYIKDGKDTDGTIWYRCTTHDELAPSSDAPCAGYQEIPYDPPVKVELPFSGFYESIHDSRIDDAIEQHFSYDYEKDEDREATEAERNAIFMADVDWNAIREEYARSYVDAFSDEFELHLTYDGLQSPREYNFSSDRVFAKMPASEFNLIRREVEALPNYPAEIRERFTSRSGFWSNYSPDHTDEQWTRPVLDECQTLVIFQLWLDHRHEEDPNNEPEWSEREYYICDEFAVNEFASIDNAIEKIEQYLKKEEVKE